MKLAPLVLPVFFLGCRAAAPPRTSHAEARADVQVDDLRMMQTRVATVLDQPVSRDLNLTASADASSMQVAGEHDPELHSLMLAVHGNHPAVLAAAGGTLGVRGALKDGGAALVTVSGAAGGSWLTDGARAMGVASVDASLDGATLTGTLGLHYQRLTPDERRVTLPDSWPANRAGGEVALAGTFAVSHGVELGAGASLRVDGGQLANPYQLAFYRSGLPTTELVPDLRVGGSFFTSATIPLSPNWALHGRASFYGDDWAIAAASAEGAVSFQPSEELRVVLRYGFIDQLPASFYAALYETTLRDSATARTSSAPLGSLDQNEVELSLRWRPVSLFFLSFGYAFTATHYREADFFVLAHTPSLGLGFDIPNPR
ncbi:MAG: DUF3570 domain-containing protein [Polyangiaceae bacterium]